MTDSKPVFLIGFMGSGKTTWGRKLALKTGRAFIDLDEEIVNETGVPIAEYFSQHGETAFRTLESRILKNLPFEQPAVVATGGGTPCYFDNMAWMNKTGKTIYLCMPPKALWSRLMQTDIAARPALGGLTGMALLDDITAKLADRTPHYQQATHIVDQLSMRLEDLISLSK
ncbi:shikimate kinase [Parapedobacter sp. 10938]|uniref:shikimate kinase n=1 Tax=Parapedobacter flavus TaxID=3110225 RepID=UPI002DBE485A|nr:shikimate kinase [Parapedobacter sp. 10938]MEC3880364.1 shikimate kinase [Parapedobacter sp. 10938]